MSSNVAQASLTFTLKEYEETYNLLKNENKSRPKVLSMLGASCFFTGRFEEALEVFNKLFIRKDIYLDELGCSIENYDSYGRGIHKILIPLGIDNLPKNLDYNYKQSIEKSNEQYPELDYINGLFSRVNQPTGQAEYESFVEQIYKDMKSNDNIKRATAYLNAAEIHYRRKDLKNAFNCYYDAISAEPSKALYYGYAAQAVLGMGDRNTIPMMTLYTRRAVDLDPSNAKWRMLHGIACFHLSNIISSEFANHADLELKNALKYCRKDQVSLRNAITDLVQGISNKRK